MLAWYRYKYRDQEADVTLYNLFVGACIEHFHVRDEVCIQSDLENFERHGNIPLYVLRFVRQICATHFLLQQPKGDRSCISAN
jgi:hypothetical protein